jgi:hypothetical protein
MHIITQINMCINVLFAHRNSYIFCLENPVLSSTGGVKGSLLLYLWAYRKGVKIDF